VQTKIQIPIYTEDVSLIRRGMLTGVVIVLRATMILVLRRKKVATLDAVEGG
jgi:hypothetical protein